MSAKDSKVSKLARQKAAQAWCTERTSHMVIDSVLTEEFARILDQYIEALRWCSGSADFGSEGKARKGWEGIVEPLLKCD